MNPTQGNSVPSNAPDPNQNPTNTSRPNQMHRNARRDVNPPAVDPAPFAVPYPGIYQGMVNNIAAVYPNNNHNPPYNPNPNFSFICPCCANVHSNPVSTNSDNSIPLNPNNFHNPNDALGPDPGLIHPLSDDPEPILPNYPTVNHIPGRSINANLNGNHIPGSSANSNANHIPDRSISANSNANHIPGSNIPSFRRINSNLIEISIPPGGSIMYQASLYQPSPANRVVSAPNPIYSPARDYNSDQYPHRPCVPRAMQPVSNDEPDFGIQQYRVRPPADLDLIATARRVRHPPSPGDDELPVPNARSSAWESDSPGYRQHGPFNPVPAQNSVNTDNPRTTASNTASSLAPSRARRVRFPCANSTLRQTSTAADLRNIDLANSVASRNNASDLPNDIHFRTINASATPETARDNNSVSNSVANSLNYTNYDNHFAILRKYYEKDHLSPKEMEHSRRKLINSWNAWNLRRENDVSSPSTSTPSSTSACPPSSKSSPANHSATVDPGHSGDHAGSNMDVSPVNVNVEESQDNPFANVDQGSLNRNTNLQLDTEPQEQNAVSNVAIVKPLNADSNIASNNIKQPLNADANIAGYDINQPLNVPELAADCNILQTETREISTNYRQLLIRFLNRLDDVNIEMSNAYPNLHDDLINMFVSSLSPENLGKLLEQNSNAIRTESVAQNQRNGNQEIVENLEVDLTQNPRNENQEKVENSEVEENVNNSGENDVAQNSRNENQENNFEMNTAVPVAETRQEPVQWNSNLESCSDNANMEPVAVQNPDAQIKLEYADDIDVINMDLDTVEVTIGDTSIEDSTTEILLDLSNASYVTGIGGSSEFQSQLHFTSQLGNSPDNCHPTVNITKAHSNMPNRNIQASNDTLDAVPLNLSLKDTGNFQQKDTTSEAAQRQDVQVTPQAIHSQTGIKLEQDDEEESRAIAQLFLELSKSVTIEPPIKKVCRKFKK